MEWKPLHGFKGLYSVSDTGLVRAEAKVIKRPSSTRGKLQHRKQKMMRTPANGHGYASFPATKDGQRKTVDVHRAVYEAHVRPLESGEHVHHVNDCKLDNQVSNLQAMPDLEHKRHTQQRIKDKIAVADFLTQILMTKGALNVSTL